MSEPAAKRRLREWKRRISTDLTLQGYEVETYETSQFHWRKRSMSDIASNALGRGE